MHDARFSRRTPQSLEQEYLMTVHPRCSWSYVEHLQLVVSLYLHLRVNAQREAAGPGCQDAILYRQLIRRQALRCPLRSLPLIHEQRL